jgi:hypothetical protein
MFVCDLYVPVVDVGWYQDVGWLSGEGKGAAIGRAAWQGVVLPARHKSVDSGHGNDALEWGEP